MRTEGSSIIDVEPSSKCWTITRKNQRRKPRGLERKLIYDKLLPYREWRTYKVPGALFKETQGFGLTDADSRAVFTAYQGLHHHGPQYDSFPFLYHIKLPLIDVKLDRQRKL